MVKSCDPQVSTGVFPYRQNGRNHMRIGEGKGFVAKPMTLALLLTWGMTLQAENMDRYRGVDNSGAYAAKGLLRAWPDGGPKLLWKTDVGAGWANVAVVDGKVYIPAD